jgi:hypothetical protein
MGEKKFVYNLPNAFCGGEIKMEECETAQSMIYESQSGKKGLKDDIQPIWTTPVHLTRLCMECRKVCVVEVETIDSQLTGSTRFTFTE